MGIRAAGLRGLQPDARTATGRRTSWQRSRRNFLRASTWRALAGWQDASLQLRNVANWARTGTPLGSLRVREGEWRDHSFGSGTLGPRFAGASGIPVSATNRG